MGWVIYLKFQLSNNFDSGRFSDIKFFVICIQLVHKCKITTGATPYINSPKRPSLYI